MKNELKLFGRKLLWPIPGFYLPERANKTTKTPAENRALYLPNMTLESCPVVVTVKNMKFYNTTFPTDTQQ
jgi:hypothetical protein